MIFQKCSVNYRKQSLSSAMYINRKIEIFHLACYHEFIIIQYPLVSVTEVNSTL
jgi:hypothetical protein